MASYERYFNHLIKQAQTNTAAYTNQRRRQADEDAEGVREQYRAADRTAVSQANAALSQTESDYRKIYDANAVGEAVARRNAAEAMANSQLTNSGRNATQQTAISLQRSRADSDATLQKQAAVERIMRELDAERAKYRAQSVAQTAEIYKQAQEDMRDYEIEQTEAAQKQAQAMQDADVEAAKQAAEMSVLELEAATAAQKLKNTTATSTSSSSASNKTSSNTSNKTSSSTSGKTSTNTSSKTSSSASSKTSSNTSSKTSSSASNKTSSNTSNKTSSSTSGKTSTNTSSKTSSSKSDKTSPNTSEEATTSTQSVLYKAYENTPSKTAIEINAATRKRDSGDLEAASYLRRCVNEGLITAEERSDLMTKLGIREPQQYSHSYVSGMVDRMIKAGNIEDARLFVDTLIDTGSVEPSYISDVIRRLM